jgi:hypothetical protein
MATWYGAAVLQHAVLQIFPGQKEHNYFLRAEFQAHTRKPVQLLPLRIAYYSTFADQKHSST